jgi:hypothetical protein
MAIVKGRTKEWETMHSLWILWSFFGFGFISFAIISNKLKNKVWACFALIYAAIFAVGVLTVPDDAPIYLSYDSKNVVLAIVGVGWVVSLIHCFLVRKEYLIGLDAIDSDEHRQEEAERIRKKYQN